MRAPDTVSHARPDIVSGARPDIVSGARPSPCHPERRMPSQGTRASHAVTGDPRVARRDRGPARRTP